MIGAAATNPQVNSAPASTLRMCQIVMALLLSSSQSEAATTGPVGLRACERRSRRDVDRVPVFGGTRYTLRSGPTVLPLVNQAGVDGQERGLSCSNDSYETSARERGGVER